MVLFSINLIDNIDKNILLDLKKSIVDENIDNSSTESPLNSKNNIHSLNGIFLKIEDELIEDKLVKEEIERVERIEEKEKEEDFKKGAKKPKKKFPKKK